MTKSEGNQVPLCERNEHLLVKIMFLLKEQDEVKLNESLKRASWFIKGGFAIRLDDSDIITI